MWTTLQVLASVCVCVRAASIIQPEWGYYFEQDDQGPGTYSFGYDIEDSVTRNVQFRREKRLPNGTVTGSYGLVEPDGNIKIVRYTADALGYRTEIENSQRPDESYPDRPKSLWDSSPPLWDSLWDIPPSYRAQRPSAALGYAVDSLQTLGRPVDDQRTPPVHQDRGTLRPLTFSADQSQSYPSFLPSPQTYDQ